MQLKCNRLGLLKPLNSQKSNEDMTSVTSVILCGPVAGVPLCYFPSCVLIQLRCILDVYRQFAIIKLLVYGSFLVIFQTENSPGKAFNSLLLSSAVSKWTQSVIHYRQNKKEWYVLNVIYVIHALCLWCYSKRKNRL